MSSGLSNTGTFVSLAARNREMHGFLIKIFKATRKNKQKVLNSNRTERSLPKERYTENSIFMQVAITV